MTTALHVDASEAMFEAIYAEANGNIALVPWADARPHPALITWLNAVAPSLVRCGARVAVVGCGLGDDAQTLIRGGYDVTAFDVSATAVRWARERDPDNAASYHVADVFDTPTRWRHRFDLVVEINTIQSLPPDRCADTLKAISELVSTHGYLLVIGRAANTPVSIDEGPPWAMTRQELEDAAEIAGLVAEGPVSVFDDNETPPVQRMRSVFRRI